MAEAVSKLPTREEPKKVVTIVVTSSGRVLAPYSDDLKPFFAQLGPITVERASIVEWEKHDAEMRRLTGEDGAWTVRAAHDFTLAIRHRPGSTPTWKDPMPYVGREGILVGFETREAALEAEKKFFWDLLPCKIKKEP